LAPGPRLQRGRRRGHRARPGDHGPEVGGPEVVRLQLGRGDRAVKLTDTYFLTFGALLFTIGAVGLLVRRNVLVMFMCVELMLSAVNLTFVAFASMLHDINGEAVVFFVLVVAAAEVVVGLGIIVAIFRRR